MKKSTYSNTLKSDGTFKWGIVAKNFQTPKGSPITLQPKGYFMSSGAAQKLKDMLKQD